MISLQVLQILKEKQTILDKTIKAVGLQKSCFENNSFDEEYFENIQTKVDGYVQKINELNELFEEVFPKAKVELQELIEKKDATALSIHTESEKLEKLSLMLEEEEQELKSLFQQYLSSERKEIFNKRKQKKTAAAYYKTMTKQTESISYFYDRSK